VERLPPYEKSHALVAAVRVLHFRDGISPTEQQVAELLGMAPDFARSLIRALAELEILRVIQNPFEIRVELGEFWKLEDLPRDQGDTAMESELEAFHERYRKKREEMENLFGGKGVERRQKERVDRLEDEFRNFRRRMGRGAPSSSAGDDAEDDDD